MCICIDTYICVYLYHLQFTDLGSWWRNVTVELGGRSVKTERKPWEILEKTNHVWKHFPRETLDFPHIIISVLQLLITTTGS